MNTFTAHYPHLELCYSTIDQSKIIDAFQDIKDISICWLAHEELEFKHGTGFSSIGIDCIKNKANLDFIQRGSGRIIAKVHFDQSLNTIQLLINDFTFQLTECSFNAWKKLALNDAIKKILYIDRLIKYESTGTAKELAARLGISKRHVYNYLNILKETTGKTIVFDKDKGGFVYKNTP